MDLNNLTNDQLRDHLRAGMLEWEARVSGRALRRAKLVHALMEQAEEIAHEEGDIQARSGGEGKDP